MNIHRAILAGASRIHRLIFAAALLVLLAPLPGRAFSLLGPTADWMKKTNFYTDHGEIGGPMALGEEYRWNVPVLTYAFDQSFVDYFGSNGVAAVESAITPSTNRSKCAIGSTTMVSVGFVVRFRRVPLKLAVTPGGALTTASCTSSGLPMNPTVNAVVTEPFCATLTLEGETNSEKSRVAAEFCTLNVSDAEPTSPAKSVQDAAKV